jgi:sarcosine oxidase
MTTSRFVVVGAGLAGSATAWQLARRGHEVTVLERSTPANRAGSSHGSARIFRYAYSNEFYARLVVESRAEWDELQRLSGKQLITRTGAVDFGIERDPADLARVLERAGVDHELLTAAQARDRWPQITFESDVLWHGSAGVIDAETSVTAMLDLAAHHGAVVEAGWPVASVERRGAGYRVVAEDGSTADAAHVIVSAGGWLPDLLGALSLPPSFLAAFPPLEVRQENTFHFPYREEIAPGDGWPTFIHKRRGMQIYSLPGGRDAALPDGRSGQKLAEYNGGRSIGSAARQDGQVDPVNRQRVIEYVQRVVPGLVPQPYAERTCLFTNTPNEDFVVDGVDGVTVLSPCSGHGAKFAPLMGAIAAEAALGAPAPAPFLVRS